MLLATALNSKTRNTNNNLYINTASCQVSKIIDEISRGYTQPENGVHICKNDIHYIKAPYGSCNILFPYSGDNTDYIILQYKQYQYSMVKGTHEHKQICNTLHIDPLI